MRLMVHTTPSENSWCGFGPFFASSARVQADPGSNSGQRTDCGECERLRCSWVQMTPDNV